MKKLLLIALIFAMPKIYSSDNGIKTYGKSAQEIAQQARNAASELLDVIKNKADNLKKIWGATPLRTGQLLPLIKEIHEQCKEVLNNVKNTLQASNELISHQQLLGLLNKLSAIAGGRFSGINLGTGVASQIYDQTKDFYKKLVDTSSLLITPSKGSYTAGGVLTIKSQLAPLFIRQLIILISNHNMEVTDKEQFKNIEPLTSPILPLTTVNFFKLEGADEDTVKAFDEALSAQ